MCVCVGGGGGGSRGQRDDSVDIAEKALCCLGHPRASQIPSEMIPTRTAPTSFILTILPEQLQSTAR